MHMIMEAATRIIQENTNKNYIVMRFNQLIGNVNKFGPAPTDFSGTTDYELSCFSYCFSLIFHEEKKPFL